MRTLLLVLTLALSLQAADVVDGEGTGGVNSNVVITLNCTGRNAAYVFVTFVDYLGTYSVSSTSVVAGSWTASSQWGTGVWSAKGHGAKGITLAASEVITVAVTSGSPYLGVKAACFTAGTSTPTFAGNEATGGGNFQLGAVTPGSGGYIFTATAFAYNSTITPPSGYTVCGTEITTDQGLKMRMYYKVAPDGSSMNPTWNWDSVHYVGGNAAFSASGGGGGPLTRWRIVR